MGRPGGPGRICCGRTPKIWSFVWQHDPVPYVDIAGHRTWHEVTGDGPPVVLLHGGFASASSFFAQTPVLAQAGYRVHVPERRGHGHTPDIAGPLTYSVMADDTIAYLDAQVARPAALIGWSDGAVVALLAAQRRPDLVTAMVLIGQYYNSAGRSAELGQLEVMLDSAEAISFLREHYSAISPDGSGHFATVHAKTMQMLRTEPEIDLATLADVHVPALVLQGDRDLVTLEHSAAVAAALPDARLAVLPGTHGLPVESPATVNPLLLAFLRYGTAGPAAGDIRDAVSGHQPGN